ncbi:MAG: DUF84 family protein [Patescibacteria group bacterium]
MAHNQPKVVICASTSDTKVNALDRALNINYPSKPIELFPIATNLESLPDWHINAQPVGIETTQLYAVLRAETAITMYSGNKPWDLVVAIENGIVCDIEGNTGPPNRYYDLAVVYIKTWNQYRQTIYSPRIAVPAWAYLEASERGFRTTTCGDIIHEQYPCIPNNDWHQYSSSLCQGDSIPVKGKKAMNRTVQIMEALNHGFKKMTTNSIVW